MAYETVERTWSCESVPRDWDDSTPPTYDLTCTEPAYPVPSIPAPVVGSDDSTVSLAQPQFELVLAFLAVLVFLAVASLISGWGRRG